MGWGLGVADGRRCHGRSSQAVIRQACIRACGAKVLFRRSKLSPARCCCKTRVCFVPFFFSHREVFGHLHRVCVIWSELQLWLVCCTARAFLQHALPNHSGYIQKAHSLLTPSSDIFYVSQSVMWLIAPMLHGSSRLGLFVHSQARRTIFPKHWICKACVNDLKHEHDWAVLPQNPESPSPVLLCSAPAWEVEKFTPGYREEGIFKKDEVQISDTFLSTSMN